MSNATVLLPLPLTPVITVKRSRGIATSTSRRLCSRAPTTSIAALAPGEDRGWTAAPTAAFARDPAGDRGWTAAPTAAFARDPAGDRGWTGAPTAAFARDPAGDRGWTAAPTRGGAARAAASSRRSYSASSRPVWLAVERRSSAGVPA